MKNHQHQENWGWLKDNKFSTTPLPEKRQMPEGIRRRTASAVLHPIRHLKPRLFAQGVVANPRDTYGYRCGLRLALTKNPS
ncbi:MAG: hypothetical protein ACT4NV_18470, partial [Rhodoferax sp.]